MLKKENKKNIWKKEYSRYEKAEQWIENPVQGQKVTEGTRRVISQRKQI